VSDLPAEICRVSSCNDNRNRGIFNLGISKIDTPDCLSQKALDATRSSSTRGENEKSRLEQDVKVKTNQLGNH